jgi:hypothetical protein
MISKITIDLKFITYLLTLLVPILAPGLVFYAHSSNIPVENSVIMFAGMMMMAIIYYGLVFVAFIFEEDFLKKYAKKHNLSYKEAFKTTYIQTTVIWFGIPNAVLFGTTSYMFFFIAYASIISLYALRLFFGHYYAEEAQA